MFRTSIPPLRYLEAARRARIARLTAVGAVVLIPSACGNDDAEVFANATVLAEVPAATEPAVAAGSEDTTAPTEPTVGTITTTPPETSAAPATTPPPSETTLAPETSVAPATTAPPADTAPPAEPAAVAIPATSELVVSFTYASAEAGQRSFNNPYVAVWVEDADGALVDTLGLWYQTSGRGQRWLDHLRQWFDASDGEVVNSGATRPAGEYALAWDGTDASDQLVAPGDYVLVIEAAREDGPYSVTSTPITLGADGFVVALADDGELTQLSATMSV